MIPATGAVVYGLEAWAERNPRVRWPLVWLLLLGLWGLGGWVAPE